MELLEKHAFLIFYLCGLVISVFLVWRYKEKAKIRSFVGVVLICIVFLVGSLASSYLFAFFEDIITGNIPNGEISTFGGFLFGVPILVLCVRLLRFEIKGILDLFALFACPTLFAARCVCLVSGCCTGRNIANTAFRWPTRETELLFYGIMLSVFLKKENQKQIPGTFAPLFMGAYGCFRFINEFFRGGEVGTLHLAHLWSAICAIVGFSIYFEMQNQNQKKRMRRS